MVPVTLSTVAKAIVPSATPMTANAVPTEMNARFRDRMYRRASSSAKPIVGASSYQKHPNGAIAAGPLDRALRGSEPSGRYETNARPPLQLLGSLEQIQ